jgi:hypothetical protein
LHFSKGWKRIRITQNNSAYVFNKIIAQKAEEKEKTREALRKE